MIVQINNYTNYRCNMDTLKLLSHNRYPKQDIDKIGKIILLRFKDEFGLNNRIFVDTIRYPMKNYKNSGTPTYFLILRYDLEDPFKIILMSDSGKIIVSNKETIENISYPPGYTPKFITSENVSDFIDKKEFFFTPEIDMVSFLKKYENEFVHQYKIQDYNILGNVCYTEYYTDLLKTEADKNILSPSREKTFNELKKQLLEENPDLDIFPDEILKSFPIYYNQRNQSYIDKPLRVINNGIIIRVDNDSNGELVVAENIKNKIRFVTAQEAFIYTDNIPKQFKYTEISNLSVLLHHKIYTGEE